VDWPVAVKPDWPVATKPALSFNSDIFEKEGLKLVEL
jgi:hypothetical protein